MDDLAEEISSSLDSGGRPVRGAAPTIILGLGEFGHVCLDRLRRNFDNWPIQTSALTIKAQESLTSGVSWLSEGDQHLAIFPGAGGTRAAVYREVLKNRSLLENWFKKTTTDLLGRPGNEGPIGRVRVFFVGRAEEIDGSALAVAVPALVRAALTGYVSNWDVSLYGFILLPKGRCRRGAQVYALLRELRSSGNGRDKIFLLSEANADGLINMNGSADLISEFIGLTLEWEFAIAVADVLDIAHADFAGFGLTSVVHPVGRIIADESARFARELIGSGLFSSAGEPFYRLADEYVKSERLSINHLYNALITNTEGVITDHIDVNSLILTQTPKTFWPDRIAGYDAYLGRELLPGLIAEIDKNLSTVSANTSVRLRAKTDELMSERAALEKTQSFVARLLERADELKTEAERAKQEVGDRTPDLMRRYDVLARRIENLPSLTAILSRTTLISVLLFFSVRQFIYVLRRLPDRYIDHRYLPPALPAAVLAVLVMFVCAWLIYRRAEHGVYRARDRYMTAVNSKYRLALKEYALEALSWWLGGRGYEEPAGRNIVSFKEILNGERVLVARINRFYLRINDKLKLNSADIQESRIRRSVFKTFGQEANLRYKKGRYNVADETEQFAVSGHADWRRLEFSELDRRLREFCRHGLEFIDNRSLDSLVIDFDRRGWATAGVIEDLRRTAQPYIAITGDLPPVRELVGIYGGSQSAIAGQAVLSGQAAIVPIWNRHRLTFVRLVCPIHPEQLAGFGQWRSAYELALNKREIDCMEKGEDGSGKWRGEADKAA